MMPWKEMILPHYVAMIMGSVMFDHPNFMKYYEKMWNEFGPKIEIN